MRKIILIGLLLLFSNIVEATDINYVNTPGATYTHSHTHDSSNTLSETGSEANMHDENESTYYSAGGGGAIPGEFNWGNGSVSFEVTFPTAVSINKIRGILGGGGGIVSTAKNWNIQYYNGSWHTLDSGTTGGGIKEYTSLTLTNVTKVSCYAYGSGQCTQPGTPGFGSAAITELYAWGPPIGVDGGYATIY
jgi:hypothetical protein